MLQLTLLLDSWIRLSHKKLKIPLTQISVCQFYPPACYQPSHLPSSTVMLQGAEYRSGSLHHFSYRIDYLSIIPNSSAGQVSTLGCGNRFLVDPAPVGTCVTMEVDLRSQLKAKRTLRWIVNNKRQKYSVFNLPASVQFGVCPSFIILFSLHFC